MRERFLAIAESAAARFRAILAETFEQGEGGDSKKTWPRVKLGDIGRIAMCKRILKSQTQSEGDIPFFKIGTFGKTPDAYISQDIFDEYSSKFSYPRKGDILISAAGTIGRTMVFDGKPSYFQDSNIVWLEHDRSAAINEYLMYFYLSEPWVVSNGATILRLYNGDIESLRIPLPPIPVQRSIVARLDAARADCGRIEELARKGAEGCVALRAALLKEAFE